MQFKKKSRLFHVFLNEPAPPEVVRAAGIYIETKKHGRLMDMSAGGTSYATLGWCNEEVNDAIIKQVKKFGHLDYKMWSDENTELLADILLSKREHKLDRVYFSGNSGSEACEAAMRMSYQCHYDRGFKSKKWFISRKQSYHGSTADALSLGERPNLEFFRGQLSPFRAQIEMHHPLYNRNKGETVTEYAIRSAQQLEEKILEIGPENVAAFVGETIMGGLVGNVPPAKTYWQSIRKICDKYEIHLILDEVYCGTGVSGKIYCCDWDGVTPDFILLGKTLAAGYSALSAVVTSSQIEQCIRDGQGRLQHSTTHQALSTGVAAALAVQTIVHRDGFLERVNNLSSLIQSTLRRELGQIDEVRSIHGRGLRLTIEHNTEDNMAFATRLKNAMLERHQMIIDSKWHRVCINPPLITSEAQVSEFLEAFIKEYREAL